MLRRAPPNNPQLLWGDSLEFSDREESGKSNLCFPDSCEDARQQVGAGSACPAAASGCMLIPESAAPT